MALQLLCRLDGSDPETLVKALMDDSDTSHPFYWAAFAIVGDGAAPLHK